jgi:hypothetical protein
MRYNRLLFQLAVSTPRTGEIGFGLLPTQIAQEAKGKENCPSQVVENELAIIFQDGTTSQLNHRLVIEMMGFPPDWTELPFQNCEKNQ